MKHLKLLVIILVTITVIPANADESLLYSFKSLSLEMANKAAIEAIKDCRKRGFSIAVAVVDRGGNLQTLMRDRFAGPHTIETATRKAWTANSFRQSTDTLAQLLKENKIPNQIQHNPGALLVGGGQLIQAQGQTIGGIGVSGAPPGQSESQSIDSLCAKAGIKSVQDELEFSD